MIYVDVTGAARQCSSAGMDRVVRGMYREFLRKEKVVPVVWQSGLNSYCRLSPTQWVHLRGMACLPFEGSLLKGLDRLIQFQFNRLKILNLSDDLKPGDIFLQPEVFQDERIEWFDQHLPKWSGVKKVAIFYDALNWSHPHLSATGRLVQFENYLKTLSGFDQVFAVSEFSAAALRRFWEENFCQTPRLDSIHPVLSWKKRSRTKPIRNRRPVIPYVARLEPRKNHFALMDACCELWDENYEFELVLVGEEGPGQGRQIARKIRQLQKQGRSIRWKSKISSAKVKRLYRNALFSVYPSMAEGFAFPVLESLWWGAPCVCHNSGAVAEVAHRGCLQIDARYVENIADGLRRLLNEPELLRRLGREARERNFRTWSDYVEELRTLW